MSDYIKIDTLAVTSLSEIRVAHPNMSIPDGADLSDIGYARYERAAQPARDPMTQGVREIDPVLVDGVYQQQWVIHDLPAEQIATNQAAAVQALVRSITDATQARLDDFAKTRNYDGILSACTYASSAVPKFAGEGQCAVNARDATWAALYAIMADVQSGTRPMPASFLDVELELPIFDWGGV